MPVIAVNALNQKVRIGNIDEGIRPFLDFGDFQKGLLEVVKDQLLAVAGLQPNGLSRIIPYDVRVPDGLFRHLVAVNRNPGQDSFAVRTSGHIGMIAIGNPPLLLFQ